MSDPAWDLALDSVEEALRAGAVPSLERLGRLGQVGGLPAFVAALRGEGDPAAAMFDHAREREALGFGSAEIVAEVLGLGRVLDRHGEVGAREALDWTLVLYFERVTGELAEQARRDPLTGLLNHLAFHTLVAKEVARARRYRGGLALVLFDLDRFKETNDREGHQEGDRVLRAFASVLASTVRETDAVGRLGGDEFAALLLQPNARSVRAFLRRLSSRLPAGVSMSAGAAFLSPECPTSERLFALADRELYAEKSAKAA